MHIIIEEYGRMLMFEFFPIHPVTKFDDSNIACRHYHYFPGFLYTQSSALEQHNKNIIL